MINTVDCRVFVSPEWGCRAAPWLCLHNTAIKTFCKRSTFLKHWVMWLYKLPQRHELCVYKWKKHSKKKKTQCQSCLNPLWTWHASGCICYLIGVYAKYYFHLSSCCFWGCFSNLLQMWKKWKHVFFFLFFFAAGHGKKKMVEIFGPIHIYCVSALSEHSGWSEDITGTLYERSYSWTCHWSLGWHVPAHSQHVRGPTVRKDPNWF